MESSELADLLKVLRRTGGEPAGIEVKSGAGGFPTSLKETLVAFANTEGGLVLIGVDESQDFALVNIENIARYRDNLVALASDTITPVLRIATDIVELDGKLVLVAEVPPVPADQRPAYITSKGVSTGAYLRTGDGDRRMNEAEIALVYAQRTQPAYDREPVLGASQDDLDGPALRRMLERVRLGSSSLRDANNEVALYRLGVLSSADPNSAPTIAGILTFAAYPQLYFPQLMVSIVVHPSDQDPNSRFLDNVTVRGSIPDMVAEALSAIRRNLAARAVVDGQGRTDHLDYPMESIREAVVNALLHRDYSPVTRGAQVQVELFPDRLVIRSPGGLYGPISEDDLGEAGISSSRNAVLANLLSDTYLPRSDHLVAENRASGIPTMIDKARSRGLPRPVFSSSITSFTVTMGRSELLGPDVRRWLDGLEVALPTPVHEIALAMMRGGGYTTNAALREWGADRIAASQVLRDLVEWGLAIRHGGRRYARYSLDPALQPKHSLAQVSVQAEGNLRPTVTVALQTAGESSAASIQAATGLGRAAVVNYLNALIATGEVEALGPTRSPKRRYRWIGPARPSD